MFDLNLQLKPIIILILNLAAYTAGLSSYAISLHKYEWLGEPGLATSADADSVLVILLFSSLGAMCAVIALIVSLLDLHQPFGVMDFALIAVSAIGLIMCVCRFVAVMPYYSG